MTNVLRPRIAPAVLATAIAALLVAGCGAGGSAGNPTASASAKSPMVVRADAICGSLNARRKAANQRVGAVTSVAALAKVAEIAPGLVAYEHSAIAELRKLIPPSELASAWQKILAGTELLAEHAGRLGEAAKAKDLKAVETLIKEDQKSEKEMIPVATSAGFKHCGRNV